jgi:hypothetical protein
MTEAKVNALVKVWDPFRMAADALDEFLETVAPPEVKQAAAVKEETFTILSFEKQTGDKLGEFELATRKANDASKFQSAFNILEKSNATIARRYHGQDYEFSYWLFGGRIYSQ